MNATLSLSGQADLDTLMLKIAREIVMDMHPLDKILEHHEVLPRQFEVLQRHPRFIGYLQSEREAWNSATNTEQRVKLKAGVVMEDFLLEAHSELHNKKTPLNQRVELGKLVAKLAGLGEAKVPLGGGGPAFSLQINIAPGATPVVISAKQIDHDEEEEYSPFTSPDTLGEM